MPQIDIFTFLSQTFFFLLLFYISLSFLEFYILPKFYAIFWLRSKLTKK